MLPTNISNKSTVINFKTFNICSFDEIMISAFNCLAYITIRQLRCSVCTVDKRYVLNEQCVRRKSMTTVTTRHHKCATLVTSNVR